MPSRSTSPSSLMAAAKAGTVAALLASPRLHGYEEAVNVVETRRGSVAFRLVGAIWAAALGMSTGAAAQPSVPPPTAGAAKPISVAATAPAASFVDEASCAGCHRTQFDAWAGSQHDLAMQDASPETVLGDFADAHFSYAGSDNLFFRRDGKFYVRTDGPDGTLGDYQVKYTFGVEPLQQYLVELPRGRVQALSIAWDTRERKWFHLYPDERVDFRDELHWSKPAQNWNHMCGECHATGYRKQYDAATDTYKTTAARFDVGCQACHGPASRHLDWARSADAAARSPGAAKSDFALDLGADSRLQIETCARCHSRRATLTPDYVYGKALMDSHLPSLLEEDLYFADGQILEEVYVYGSFLQSRMHAVGVRCSDCHDPHSAQLRASGNALCVSCHNKAGMTGVAHVDGSGLRAVDYDSPAHHFHAAGKPGSQCVDCHAPARTYMQVDPRRDHSFRVPRPDLSVAIGTPNACGGCHADQSAQWAADAVARWYGAQRRRERHYGVALDAGRHAKAGAVPGLVALAADTAHPAIVRATSLELLARYPGRSGLQATQRGLRDADPLVRLAAIRGQEQLAAAERVAALAPLLDDPVRAVRSEAARQLAPFSASLAPHQKKSLDAALVELEAAQNENADRPEALVNLGNTYLQRGDVARGEEMYRRAIALDAGFVPAYVNLADLYRSVQRDGEAEKVLREGLKVTPEAPALHGALGLLLVREGKKEAALAELAMAAEAAPDDIWQTYVYAVALYDAGRRAEAMDLLRKAAKREGSREVLLALATYERAAGNSAGMAEALRTLGAINPDDPALVPPAAR